METQVFSKVKTAKIVYAKNNSIYEMEGTTNIGITMQSLSYVNIITRRPNIITEIWKKTQCYVVGLKFRLF